ncbi:hypothetical protein AAFC00_001514 [Neodothiora populina]|uniref:Uncharacterized protein n=1 Tax=Neodothiora populina TaxID=2781224 RepID=A0ABR3PQ74_9PEZI
MGKGFDIKSAFKQAKQSAKVAIHDDDDDGSRQQRRSNAFSDFIKSNAQKLPGHGRRREKRKTHIIHIDPPSRISYTGQRPLPLNLRPTSRVIMPPPQTKEPAILATWGVKSPSIRPGSHFSSGADSHHSQGLNDSVTSRHQASKSPLYSRSYSDLKPKHLSSDEVQLMFSGAPVFDVVGSTVHPRPRVTIKADRSGLLEYARDTDDLTHSTFAAGTLGGTVSDDTINAADLNMLLEVPDMRRLSGRDPGTVGFEYFLQMPISDSHRVLPIASTLEKRKALLAEPERMGLRNMGFESLIDHLSAVAEAQQAKQDNMTFEATAKPDMAEMYTKLFSELLASPESGDMATNEETATSLETQIAAIVRILDSPDIWFDFSYVEWRIRLGQLLWSTAPEEKAELEASNGDKAVNERDVLILQIVLASELQLRLEMDDIPAKPRAFSRKVHWDLVLARRFINNVRVAKASMEDDDKAPRSSVFSALTFVTAQEDLDVVADVKPIFYPRDEEQQIGGLLHFAESLSWPDLQDIRTNLKMSQHGQQNLQVPGASPVVSPAFSAYATPVASPSALSSDGSANYFSVTRPQLERRTTTSQSVQLSRTSTTSTSASNNASAGGWLSRSWLTGLLLPGEAISHFLMSTLLENSPAAISTLGDSANLCGGFTYHGRSYWSKSSVVGRVLATQAGAAECMGWISFPSAAVDNDDRAKDGWFDVESKRIQQAEQEKPRISMDGAVAKDSAFVRDADDSKATIDEADFTWPVDSPPVLGNECRFEGLSLPTESASSDQEAVAEDSGVPCFPLSAPALKFASNTSHPVRVTIPLTYDVYFISSFPCIAEPRPTVPQPELQMLQLPSSPLASPRVGSTNQSLRPGSPQMMMMMDDTEEKALPEPPCHPLHTASYTMEIVPAATLLSLPIEDSFQRPEDGRVLVLDCRGAFCEQLQLLARAWCAKVGQHAVVGKVGRTCLSCCIREARALDVCVVIRI